MENLQIVDDYDFKDLNQAFASVNWYKRFAVTKRGKYSFDLKKLKLNYWYKNWKEVCEDLGIEYTKGRTLKEQQKIIESSTIFKKDGRAYLFEEIAADRIMSTIDDSTTVTRADCVEALLLSIFSETNNHPIALTAKGWYKLIGAAGDEWKNPYDTKGIKKLSQSVEKNENEITGNVCIADGEMVVSRHSDVSTRYFAQKTMDEFAYALKYGINNLIDKGAVSIDFVHGGYPVSESEYRRFIKDVPDASWFENEEDDENWELFVPDQVSYNNYRIDENHPETSLSMRMFNAQENTALLKYKVRAMEIVGVENESETYKDREIRQQYYNIVNYLVLKNLHYVTPARFMVAYPYVGACVKVLRTMSEREDIKALLNRKFKNGLIKSANKKRMAYQNYDNSIYNSDQFVRALNYLMKTTMPNDIVASENILRLGLMNGEYFSAKNPDYRRIGQNKDRDIIGE